MAVAALVFVGGLAAPAASVVWTNGPTDLNWSSTDNWIGGVLPAVTDDVKFNNEGAVGSAGTVNNILDADVSISSLQYAQSNYLYHTTQINSGRTLAVTNGLTVGGTLTADASLLVFTTITGTGGALSVGGNTSARLWVGQGSTINFTTPLATLDMSGLDTFQSTAGLVSVGVKVGTVANNPLHLNWPQGTLTLAKTNLIVAAGSAGTLGNAAIMVGYSPSNPGIGIVQLGQTNAILANGISVGDRRSVGTINFYSGVIANNPSLFLRSATGTRLVGFWIGDEFAEGGTAAISTGTVDLTGGTLDAQVDTLIVARGMNVNNRDSVATGTLTYQAGLLDVNTLRIGTQTGYTITTRGGIPKGTVSVNSGANGAATLLVNTTFTMAEIKVPHANANAVTADLNIAGGKVIAPSITTTATTNGATIYRGTSTITMNGGRLTVTNGIIGAPGYPITTLNMGDSVLEIPAPASGPAVVVGNLNTTSSTNSLLNISSLPLVASYPAQFPVIRYTSHGGAFDLQLGTLPAGSPSFQGYLVDNPGNGTIDLVLTNGPVGVHALTWTGATNGNWDTTTTNWLDLALNPAVFTQGDFVLFDDTASTNNVTLTGLLAATTMTVNNPTKDYAFGGSGGLNGQAGTYGLTGLDKEGDASLVISNSGANTFTGSILIGGGTVRIAGSNDRLPVTATVTLADAASAALDLNNLNQTLGALSGGGASGGNVLLGSGTLTLTNGTGGYAGVISGTGKVVKRGTGSQTLSGTNLYSGGTIVSNGTLVVANTAGSGTGSGSVVILTNATLAIGNGANGLVSVAAITNSGTLALNRGDNNTFTNLIVGGGNVTKNGLGTTIIPNANPHTGTNTINFGALRMGSANSLGSGTIAVTVDQGARLELTSGITVTNPLQLTYRLEGNPPVVVPSISSVSGTNSVTGVIRTIESPLADGLYFSASSGSKLIVASPFINNGGGTAARTIRLAGAGTGDWRGVITNGTTSLTAVRKVDAGTWTLSGTNTYTGGTSIAAGALKINGQLTATSGVVASNTGTLGGSGVIAGPVSINASATLAPSGALTINNVLTLDPASTTVMALAKSAPSASVRGLTTVNLNGTLNVTLTDLLWGGEVFHLFEATSYNGTFATINLPPIDPALSWDTSFLAVDGTLRVTGSIARPPIYNQFGVSGASLVISGTNGVAGSAYVILTSTNVVLPLANWTPLLTNLFDGSGNFALTNIIDPATPARYYILQQP